MMMMTMMMKMMMMMMMMMMMLSAGLIGKSIQLLLHFSGDGQRLVRCGLYQRHMYTQALELGPR